MSDPKPRILQEPAEGARDPGQEPAAQPELTDAAEGDREQIERELDRKGRDAPEKS
jgi:hypothetical protein